MRNNRLKLFLMGGLLTVFTFGMAEYSFSANEASSEKTDIKKKLKEKRKKKHKKRIKRRVKKKSIAKKKMVNKKPSNIKKSVYAWLKKMKKRVRRSHAKHNQLVSVAAVRGSDKTDAPPLYWKGKKSKGPVDLPELEEFDQALDLAMKGDKGNATKSLKNFIKKYPQSSLVADANHTLSMLNATRE